MPGIPVVHALQGAFRMTDRQYRPLGQFVQLGVGHDQGQLENRIPDRVQTRHLQVDPQQVAGFVHHQAPWVERMITNGRPE